MNNLYNRYSDYLKNKYNTKVYKLPINIPVSCPNRDGTLGKYGCSFCSEKGAGYENLSNKLSIKEQLLKNKSYIQKKYKAKKFIAYLQNFTNTYMPLEKFKIIINECLLDDIVEIAISTRPDCINEDYLIFLKEFSTKNNINISIEIGLQTVNYHTLKKVNRGHGLAEFIDAVLRIKQFDFEICTHIILNLPWDNEDDVLENAKIISVLGINQVKIHSLYIVKNTLLAKQFLNKEFNMISLEDYKNRVIKFLEYLSPDIIIQRLIARAPEEETIFANWNTSWWKIRDDIEDTMKNTQTYQGKCFDYTNGSALKNIKK